MVNLNIFTTQKGKLAPHADTVNASGSNAYALTPKHKLAQLAATGCMTDTFYASGETQLSEVLDLTQQLEADFIAKTAVYARTKGYMKDMPALLAAVLAQKDLGLLAQCFDQVIDNGKMLRNFVQIIRSGLVGRKSLGNRPKKLVQQWLLTATEKQLLNASIGNTPSLADVVKMVHPKPQEAWRAAWFGWLLGRDYDQAQLPPITLAFEQFKQALREGVSADELTVPDVPFQMLTALSLTTKQWSAIASKASWQMVRQNLNTFARHGVFNEMKLVDDIAAKLADPENIVKAKAMPYQLMTAFINTEESKVPSQVRNALQDAMELAIQNVPTIVGKVVVCPDVSGSMHGAVTGWRGSATSKTRCIDVAALMAAAMLRKNPQAQVMPFAEEVRNIYLNPRDSIMTNAAKLANSNGGGTNVSAPLKKLNEAKTAVDLVILVSDNESWIDNKRYGATETMRQWGILKKRCPKAKLVCIDIQPYTTTQAQEQADVMNVGGFSDAVFVMVERFAKGEGTSHQWIQDIEKIDLEKIV